MGSGSGKIRGSMTFRMVGTVVLLLTVFGVIVSVIGYISFTNAFKREYSTSTYHMAVTAATLINADSIDDYLESIPPDADDDDDDDDDDDAKEKKDYLRTKQYLDDYCKAMAVSLIYVISVDTSDYERFVSVFCAIDNSVDNTKYQPWPLGYRRNTTNDEYREKYEELYNKEKPYATVYRMNPEDGQNPHITTMVPVLNSSRDVVAILCVQRPARELNEARMPYLYIIAVSTFLLAFFFTLFAGTYIRNHFVRPIKRMSDEATRFAKMNTKGEKLGNVSRINEISSLASSIDEMEEEMVSYIDSLKTVTSEKERIATELSLAARIQNNSLPNEFPAFPDRKDFDIYASMTPAKEIGGDFYNFFLVDDDHLAVVIGDVSGKGVPSALFMMVANILIYDRTKTGGTPAQILTDVNKSLFKHNRSEMFVSLWLGILEVSTGKLTASNAGHEDAAVYKKGGDFELVKTKHGFVAGGLSNSAYSDFEIELGKGDKLFIYTDGLNEASDRDNALFGSDRMMEVLDELKESSPEELINGIKKSVESFVGDSMLSDDLTMLCLERK